MVKLKSGTHYVIIVKFFSRLSSRSSLGLYASIRMFYIYIPVAYYFPSS